MKMKYTEQAVETLDDAGSVIANKNIEIEQLRQRVAELEKEQVAWKKFTERANNTVSAAEAERDKANQYWQIAEGRCDALMKQRDELLSDVERCYRMLLSEPDTQGALFKAENILREAIASVKEKA